VSQRVPNDATVNAALPDAHWWRQFWRIAGSGCCMPEEEQHLERIWKPILRDALRPSARVLEIGAGRAWLSKLIASLTRERQLTCEITASDLVDLGPDHAAELRANGISWAGGVDACALPYPDQAFDFVCGQWALEYAVDRRAAVAEIARVVRPGGSAVFVFHNRAWSSGRARHLEAIGEIFAEDYFAALRNAVAASGLPVAPAASAGLEDMIGRIRRRVEARGVGSNEIVRVLLNYCTVLADKAKRGSVSEAELMAEIARNEETLRLDYQVGQMRLKCALDLPEFKAIVDQLKAAGLDTSFRDPDFCWQVWARKPAAV
jgi:SAM-dependent methyltransferase